MNNTKPKPTSSPTRAETFPPPLMTFLRTNFGSRSSRRKSSRLMFRRRLRLTAAVESQHAEPSSPKVTCIGQVRSRKTTPPRRRFRVSKSPVCCRWIFRVRGVMLCFFKYCRKMRKLMSCGACKDRKESNYLSENRVARNRGEEGKLRSEARTAAVGCDADASPPRNALLLTRCRSASSSVGTRLWSSPSAEAEDDESDEEHERDDKSTSGMERTQQDSTAESRRDPESLKLRENRGTKVVLVAGESAVKMLKRCKSEPGRVVERLVSDPELDLTRRR